MLLVGRQGFNRREDLFEGGSLVMRTLLVSIRYHRRGGSFTQEFTKLGEVRAKESRNQTGHGAPMT